MKRILIALVLCFISIILLGCYFAPKKSHHEITFDAIPCIKPHSRYHYLTCHEIKVSIDNDEVTIPPEFDTDLASIPRWLWSFVAPSYSAFIAPAILHDYLYSCPGRLNRKEVDEIFYYSLLKEGVTKFTAYKMYLAVRMFGRDHYRTGSFCVYMRADVDPIDDGVDYE